MDYGSIPVDHVVLIIFNILIFLIVKNIMWPPRDPLEEIFKEWDESNKGLKAVRIAREEERSNGQV